MMCLMEMFCGVFADGGVATAHVAADLALAQRNPVRAFFQTFLADNRRFERRKVSFGEVLKMFTCFVHIFLLWFDITLL